MKHGEDDNRRALTLPHPVSVNNLYQAVRSGKFARVILTAKARAWKASTAKMIKCQRLKSFGADDRLYAKIVAFAPDKRQRDIDNVLKILLDAIEESGLIQNDAQIDDIQIKRGPVEPPGRVHVVIGILRKNIS